MCIERGQRAPAAGLDIGGTKTHGVILSPDGVVLAEAHARTRPGRDAVVQDARLMVERLAAQAGVSASSLSAIGAGVPGLVDVETGAVRHAVNLGVVGAALPLADRLGETFGVPVVVENDLNVAALGAAHLIASQPPGGREERKVDLAYLSLGTGLAAGLVLDGALRRGTGAAGEIGHVAFEPGGLACPCGQRGCLEMYGSGSAIERAWPGRNGRPAAADLFETAAAGDPAAVSVRDRYCDAVAAAVQLLVLCLDVRCVMLGGGVSRVGDPLLGAVRAALRRRAADSPLLASLALADRLVLAPADHPVAPIGAALLPRAR